MKLIIPWAEGVNYTFSVEKKLKSSQNKEVYLGHFQASAPPNLATDHQYCLKWITAPGTSGLPQMREYHDILSYEGEHLRQILARNAYAEHLSHQMKETGSFHPDPNAVYVTVEGVYTPLKHPSLMTVKERLLVIHQFALGLLELYQNEVCGKRILAHRDVKLSNALLEKNGILKIIDFASIKLEGQEINPSTTPYTANPGTIFTVMSPSNTAPEVVCSDFGPVSQKTDVFALGASFGEMFLLNEHQEYVNPVRLWVEEIGTNVKELSRAYHRVDQEMGCFADHWPLIMLEEELDIALQWDPALGELIEEVEALFTSATCVYADDRCSMESFVEGIERLLYACDHLDAYKTLSVIAVDRSNMDYMKHADKIQFPALIVTFGHGAFEKDATQPPTLVDSAEKLAEITRAFPPCSKYREESSSYLYALYSAVNYFFSNHPEHRFCGQLNIFADKPHNGIQHLFLEDGPHGVQDMMATLSHLSVSKGIAINVFGAEYPGKLFGENAVWHPAGTSVVKTPRAPVSSVRTPSVPAPEPLNEAPRTGTGKFGPYVRVGSHYYYLIKQ